jgi:hypothetical protein
MAVNLYDGCDPEHILSRLRRVGKVRCDNPWVDYALEFEINWYQHAEYDLDARPTLLRDMQMIFEESILLMCHVSRVMYVSRCPMTVFA